MRPERFVITDRSWELIEPLMPGTHRGHGITGKDNRLFLESEPRRVCRRLIC